MSNPKRLSEIIAGEYPSNTDAEICQAMNAKNIPSTKKTIVTDMDLLTALGIQKAVPVQVAIVASSDPTLAWGWQMLRDKGVDITAQETKTIIQGLVANPDIPFTQDDADTLFSLADTMISRAEQEGLGTVTGVDVRAARRLI